MTPEDALKAADEALIASIGKPLTDIQSLILRESLLGKTYEKMQGYDAQHIKNEGSNLWKLLSKALGERVSKTSFRGALEKRLRSIQVVSQPPNPSSYDAKTWTGRESLLNDLLSKIKQQTRLIWLTGISGVGKTSLGECLAVRAWNENNPFDWICYEIPIALENQNFTVGAATLLETYLGETNLEDQERNDPKCLINRLLRKLQFQTYWIQLDSVERLLNPENSAFVDEWWLTFLQQCLTHPEFSSRLVLTSQALPASLAEWCDRYPNHWSETRLKGLLATKQYNERLEFFSKAGISVDASKPLLNRIADIYEGHPLVLRVIAGELQQDYKGDVARYWAVNGQEFEQVNRELRVERLAETDYNKALDRRVRERVKKSLEQLPPDALNLLCRSAVYRRPVPKIFWLAMIANCSIQQQKTAYRVLNDRALIEQESIHKSQRLIRQHNLIRAVAYDLLKADALLRRTAERQAAGMYLTNASVWQASNLEKVKVFSEAVQHYYEAEDWGKFKSLPFYYLNMQTKEELYQQFFTWGYYQELIVLFKKLQVFANKTGFLVEEGRILGNLGSAYQFSRTYQQAIDCYKQALAISREISDRAGESAALGNLGDVYCYTGDYQQASDCSNLHMKIAEELGDLPGKGRALNSLGNISFCTGKYCQAVNYYRQSRNINRKTGDNRGYGTVQISIGNIFYSFAKYPKALKYYENGFSIFHEIGDQQGKGIALGNLSITHEKLGDYDQALSYAQQHLRIVQQAQNHRGEGAALHEISVVLLRLERYPESSKYLQLSLEIFTEIGDRANEAATLLSLAELHQKLGSIETTLGYCNQALAIATDLGIPLAEECKKLKAELEEKNSDNKH